MYTRFTNAFFENDGLIFEKLVRILSILALLPITTVIATDIQIFETALISQKNTNKTSKTMKKFLRKLFGRTATVQTTEGLKAQYEKDKSTLTMKIGSVSTKIENLKLQLSSMSKVLYGTENYNRKKNIGKLIKLIFALIIVAGVEMPLNIPAFEFFKMDQTATDIAAICFGLVTAFMAEVIGRNRKRGHCDDKRAESNAKIMLWGAVIVFMVTTGLRMVRSHEENMILFALLAIAQFALTFVIFWVGVMASYQHTSDTKNLVLEETFKSELKRLRNLEDELKGLEKEQTNLLETFRKNFKKADEREENEKKTQNAANLNKANDDQKSEAEKKREADEKLSNFNKFEQKFNETLSELNEMLVKYEDKDSLKDHSPFIQAKSKLGVMLTAATGASSPETEDRLAKMNDDFKTFNA